MEPNKPCLEPAVARQEVIAWLRDGAVEGDPMFMLGHRECDVIERQHEITERFLRQVRTVGFELEILPVQNGDGNGDAFHSLWTYRGNTFVGFEQPPEALDELEARVLACAALLRNDWCRSRLV